MRKFQLATVLFTLVSLRYCANARNSADLPEIALEVLAYVNSALELQLSPSELSRWNLTITTQATTCVDETVKDLATKLDYEECNRQVLANVDDAYLDMEMSGSGWEDDQASSVSTDALGKVFCNDSCQNIFMLAYEVCGLFTTDKEGSKTVHNVIEGLCNTNGNNQLCLDVVMRFKYPSDCVFEQDCSGSCKHSLGLLPDELGCCLRKEGAVTSELTMMLSNCDLSIEGICKEGPRDIIIQDLAGAATTTASTAALYLLCLWVVMFNN